MTTSSGPRLSLLRRLHRALTVLLLLTVGGFVALLCAGLLHVGLGGRKAETEATDKGDEKRADSKPAGKRKSREGRYRIVPLPDATAVLNNAGRVHLRGEQESEAWAFRYTGGYLQCSIECEGGGERNLLGPLPTGWKHALQQDGKRPTHESVTPNAEGYIILAAVQPPIPIFQALQPYFPHMGRFFIPPQIGPLDMLPILPLEARENREYRLFLSAGPPRNKKGQTFRHVFSGVLPTLTSLVRSKTRFVEKGGKDLPVGVDVVLLERFWGSNKLTLKARFLTEEEVKKQRDE
jgi:hypothetical protein